MSAPQRNDREDSTNISEKNEKGRNYQVMIFAFFIAMVLLGLLFR